MLLVGKSAHRARVVKKQQLQFVTIFRFAGLKCFAIVKSLMQQTRKPTGFTALGGGRKMQKATVTFVAHMFGLGEVAYEELNAARQRVEDLLYSTQAKAESDVRFHEETLLSMSTDASAGEYAGAVKAVREAKIVERVISALRYCADYSME